MRTIIDVLVSMMLLVAPLGCSDDGLAACGERPTGFCDPATARSCSDGADECACVDVCAIEPPPAGQDYAWRCAPPADSRCPSTVPTAGKACKTPALVCYYGACTDTVASCSEGVWAVDTIN